jgi:phospholipase/carboxylesterase
VFIAHGRGDPVMDVTFARRARELLEPAGLPVSYHESDAGHHIDPHHIASAVPWLSAATGQTRSVVGPTPGSQGR